MADGLRHVATLPDPVGEVVRGSSLPNGLELRQVRVPLGVVGIVYEARPNVTADAAGLCLKSGNAVLLRGSASAYRSNAVLVDVLAEAATAAGHAGRQHPARARHRPRERQGADAGPRAGRRAHPARRRRPHRGRRHASRRCRSSRPGVGNCTVYVDAHADLDKAVAIIVNGKTRRP